MSSRGMCARNAAFPTQKLCLKVRLCAKCRVLQLKRPWVGAKVGSVRWRLRLRSPMFGYVRLCSGMVGSVLHWEVKSEVVKRIVMVVSGDIVAWCYWEMSWQVSMVARCYRGMQLQAVKRNVMVTSRWCWVADGGAVLSANAIAGFHGDAVLLGNVIAGFNGGAQVVKRIVMVVFRWRWDADGGAV